MITFLQFAILGLGLGGGYAITGIGLTQVYRGSGVLNLAHGAVAFFSAVFFVWADQVWGLGFVPSAVLAVAIGGAIGGLIELLVMRRLRRAATLVRIIATLGVFAILEQAVPIIFGSNFEEQQVTSFYPSGSFHLGSTLALPYDRTIVVAITLLLALVLRQVMEHTSFGLATTAAAENPMVASSMGIDAGRTALLNWIIGCALAGLAGVLLVPILGALTPTPLLLLVISGLAAAMIGRFSSYGLTIVGGIAIGVGQSLLIEYQTNIFGSSLSGGWPDALPFLVIIVALMVGGTPFPKRGEITARLPRVGRTRIRPLAGVLISVAAAAAVFVTSDSLASTIATMAGLAIVGLSLVVVTGLAGQTCLAQLAISGVAAVVAARLSHSFGWPFLSVLVVGVAVGSSVGVLFALPAFRTRGPTLAIATIGVGVAIENVVLDNGNITLASIYGGTPIHPPSILGLQLNGVTYPQRYAALVVLVLGLAAVAVSNLRSSPTGRRLLAMRSSERAAAASGISLARSKTAAFVLAAILASLGGVLLAFQQSNVSYAQFDILSSLNLVIFTLIGGIGFVLGPMLGALVSPSGLVNYFFTNQATVQQWLIAFGGLGLILILIVHPNGQAELGHRLSKRLWRGRGPERTRDRELIIKRRPPAAVHVENLRVCYGSVVAVDDLNLTIMPGEVVGLIGPNGAGKTTAIDAISGFTKSEAGTVRIGSTDLTGARAYKRAASGLGRTFQTVEPFEDLTVEENLACSVEPVRFWHWAVDLFHPRPVNLPASVRRQAKALGLDDMKAEPDALSQGERRLLGVMRAVAAAPAALLLDEQQLDLTAQKPHTLVECCGMSQMNAPWACCWLNTT